MKIWELIAFILGGIIFLGLLLYIYFFIAASACGIDGCHNSCKSKPCVYYKEIGDCRNTDYKYSKEYFERMIFSGFSNANTTSQCECVPSGTIMECRMVKK